MNIPADSRADRVADAPSDNWVYRWLPRSWWPYAQLARWDRPIGWWLLLWPCWWSTALSIVYLTTNYPVFPPGGLLFYEMPEIWVRYGLFMFGAIAMRGAGCTYNDIVDTVIDAKVARTASRPIPSGRVSKRSAKVFLVAQALAGFTVLLLLCWNLSFAPFGFNVFAFWLAVASLGVVALYPFAKRITNWPQLVLGFAFSWGALMGFAVPFGTLWWVPLALYLGCVAWTIGYDTIYAHQDKEDDAVVGVRSTALLFGEMTRAAIVIFYGATLAFIALAVWGVGAGWPAYLGLVLGGAHMAWQVVALDIDDPDQCLKLFRSNTQFGWIVFFGFVAAAFV